MTEPSHRIAVLGAGSWGTTFAKLVADANAAADVILWARREEVVQEINERNTNSQYLGDIVLPSNISATSDIAEALVGTPLVVLAVPAQSLRAQLEAVEGHLEPDVSIISLMKGLERGTDLRMSQVISEVLELNIDQIAVLSGPNLAMEIARKEPTASVVACSNSERAAWIASSLVTDYFRPYTNNDVIGVEIGGIVKNVIALAVGICDGKGMGDNTKASVITRGLAETTRLAMALGGQQETLSGLAGLGDLVATCASPLSRNRTAGRLLGQGHAVQDLAQHMTQTAEGTKSAAAVLHLARENKVDMPITEAVVAVLDGTLTVDSMANKLLGRQLKSEGIPT
ncbi:NAD(P)H-dependent glycerol-3-phosphate dehydrogenase [Neomicrococcus aestuarii]|uniref:Glycerol-3-phosphate dehydrogenase [NAD(P)+] n=1 Tax=Neomicrococcus aestuarii TaxID=556325 RepID=A0A1L2ZL28_9MICC|nr:NAD(P)H-dependent glycerol-3-phosphate dehydrogenase [Neomicrococcus aestuarii]APF39919.1 glycerol-3-phosphate dehydrogenase [Neomicrococcus aestuarii]